MGQQFHIHATLFQIVNGGYPEAHFVRVLMSFVSVDPLPHLPTRPQNVKSVMDGSSNLLLEFYAPWCGEFLLFPLSSSFGRPLP